MHRDGHFLDTASVCFRRRLGVTVTAMRELARLLLARLYFAGSSDVCRAMHAGVLPVTVIVGCPPQPS